MIVDSLTLAGLAAVAPFALMPILMGREFFRVSEAAELQPVRVQARADARRLDLARRRGAGRPVASSHTA